MGVLDLSEMVSLQTEMHQILLLSKILQFNQHVFFLACTSHQSYLEAILNFDTPVGGNSET